MPYFQNGYLKPELTNADNATPSACIPNINQTRMENAYDPSFNVSALRCQGYVTNVNLNSTSDCNVTVMLPDIRRLCICIDKGKEVAHLTTIGLKI